MAARGAFNSRIGFIMAAVGSAVGLGNLWRFPQITSQNGGAAFVIIYLVLLFMIGLPALLAELSIGRKRGLNAVQAFTPDAKGREYGWMGFVFLFTAILLLSYYSVIAGWALRFLAESFFAPYFDDPAGWFSDIAFGSGAIVYHFLFMAITVFILTRGVSAGIEKANLIMMPILFLSVIAIAIYGLVQDANGGWAGVAYYIKPDFGAVFPDNFSDFSTLYADAAGQTFFSIGLGLGTMLTYSSYMDRRANLQSTAYTIGLADTGVAVLAGFMVFPLLFGLGFESAATDPNTSTGGALFIALPAAFGDIGGTLGGIFAGAFFLLLVFAALSSALSLLEVPVSYVVDRWPHVGRLRAVLLLGLGVYVFGVPSAIWSEWNDFADALVTPLLLAGGLMITIYAGWIDRSILDEMRVGAKRDAGSFWVAIIRYPLPVILGALFLFAIISFFQKLPDIF